MSWISRFLKDIRSLDKSAFSITTGFRAAAFAIAPIIAGFALHQPTLLFASLGAIFLTNTEKAFYTIPSVITLENSDPYLRVVLLFSFAVMLYATMRVNLILTQIFLVPFIIILLNIYYPGEWYLSFIRILDVAIGGAIAVTMVYLWITLSGSRLFRE
jgi:hypothetical protein